MGSFLIARRHGQKDVHGLEQIRLTLYVDGVEEDSVFVNSGSPFRQKFLSGDQYVKSGSLRPIPEGTYTLGVLEWATGSDDYSGNWGAGLGPLWISIVPTFNMNRGDFGIHLDSNRSTAPGSAGCLVAPTLQVLKIIAEWWKKHDPRKLYVDWGLGYVQLPQLVVDAPKQKQAVQIAGHSGKLRIKLPNQEWQELDSVNLVCHISNG